MLETSSIDKSKLKVYVKMSDGQRLLGFFYVSEAERLQDILNDDRAFLPLNALGDNGKYTLIVIAKRYMQQIEEVTDLPDLPPPSERRGGDDRRAGNDRRQQTPPKFELD